jgi:hypothetical protein
VWNVLLGIALCVLALVGLLAAILFAIFARPILLPILSRALTGGGERKNYFKTVRGFAVALLFLGVFVLAFAIPRGRESHRVLVVQSHIGEAAGALLAVSMALFGVWWVRATAAVRRAQAPKECASAS